MTAEKYSDDQIWAWAKRHGIGGETRERTRAMFEDAAQAHPEIGECTVTAYNWLNRRTSCGLIIGVQFVLGFPRCPGCGKLINDTTR